MLKQAWRAAPRLVAITAIMIAYSVILMVAAWALGIYYGIGSADYTVDGHVTQVQVQGYFQKLNWLLFPIYWPVIALLIHFSWKFYMDGWRSLAGSEVLYQRDVVAEDSNVIEPLLNHLSIVRRYLMIASVPIGCVLSAIDGKCLFHEYNILSKFTCSAPDFTVAFRLPSNFLKFQPNNYDALGVFVLAQYFMQAILIAGAFIVLFQLLIHLITSLRFENLKLARAHRLSLRLNVADELEEFGLVRMNKAINLTYVFVALGMIIPVISVVEKPPGGDIGKSLMSLLLPLLLGAPAVIPIWDRVVRWNTAARFVQEQHNEVLEGQFLKQKLWPLDKTAFAYLGKFCFAIAWAGWLYVVFGDLKDLLKAIF